MCARLTSVALACLFWGLSHPPPPMPSASAPLPVSGLSPYPLNISQPLGSWFSD